MICPGKIGSDDDLARLNAAAWRVLERTGFKICSERLLANVEALGARDCLKLPQARFSGRLCFATRFIWWEAAGRKHFLSLLQQGFSTGVMLRSRAEARCTGSPKPSTPA